MVKQRDGKLIESKTSDIVMLFLFSILGLLIFLNQLGTAVLESIRNYIFRIIITFLIRSSDTRNFFRVGIFNCVFYQ